MVVEIPRDCGNKYEYDGELDVFRPVRVPAPEVAFPVAYGFVPGTLAGDGDPLDAVVLTREPTFPGCLIEARPIGVLAMRDAGELDEKILAVPVADPVQRGIEDLENVPAGRTAEIECFFGEYKRLEGGNVETFGWRSRSEAERVVRDCMRAADRH